MQTFDILNLRLFDLSEFIVWILKGCKEIGIRKFEFVAKFELKRLFILVV